MDNSKKQELMKLLGITDKRLADDVISYAQRLKMSENERTTNEFAIAKTLNESVMEILNLVNEASRDGFIEVIDITQLNRAYVLLVTQLKVLYNRNLLLFKIEPKPIWRNFDVLDGAVWEISEYLSNWNNDSGQGHIAQVNKYCIITDSAEPKYPPELKKIIDESDTTVPKYRRQLLEAQNKKNIDNKDWHIPDYTLTYKPDGTILINGVLKLKKAHAGSATERLLEQAIKQPETLFKPELGQTSRNLSTILSSAGFTATLRELFFPTVSKDKGIIFRPVVSHATTIAEHIDTADLDLKLKHAGADTQPSLEGIPF